VIMFRSDDAGLERAMRLAFMSARRLGHPRVGSEHLLLALASDDGAVADVLARAGVTGASVREASARESAGASADRNVLATLGVHLDRLLEMSGPALLDRTVGRGPLFPLGNKRERRRCAQMDPPVGIDAQAAYEASLRMALARRERPHRTEHLALTLVSLDPGVDWVLTSIGVDRHTLLADLADRFPPPQRNPLLRAERRFGRLSRQRDIVRRYQRVTGRTAIDGTAMVALIAG